MKKTYPFAQEGKHPDRILDAIKHDIRKYIKRERSRALPEGVDFWDFDCRAGATEPESAMVHVAELSGLVDSVAKAGSTGVYIEIVAKHGRRQQRAAEQP